MHLPLRAPSILIFAVLAAFIATSAFAQTEGAVQPVLLRSSHSVVRAYVEQRNPLHALPALPANIVVAGVYAAVVESMRVKSPTFRRQCVRIANARQLTVVIETEISSVSRRAPAQTRITRYQHGGMRATVRVTPSYRTAELIAHELEHVLEQLDEVDLAAKARLAASGVSRCDCGDGAIVFETARAVAAGQRVARELEQD